MKNVHLVLCLFMLTIVSSVNASSYLECQNSGKTGDLPVVASEWATTTALVGEYSCPAPVRGPDATCYSCSFNLLSKVNCVTESPVYRYNVEYHMDLSCINPETLLPLCRLNVKLVHSCNTCRNY